MITNQQKIENERYEAAWQDLRSRELHVTVGGILLMIAASIISSNFVRSYFNPLFAFFLYFVPSVWASAKVARFLCPRCGKIFFQRPMYSNQWSTLCLHCGLAKGARDSHGNAE